MRNFKLTVSASGVAARDSDSAREFARTDEQKGRGKI